MVSKMEQYDRHLGRCYTSQDPWIELARRGAVGVPWVENRCEKGQEEKGLRHSHKKGTERIMKILLLQKIRKKVVEVAMWYIIKECVNVSAAHI